MVIQGTESSKPLVLLWVGMALALATLGGAVAFDLYLEHGRVEAREQDRLATQARVIADNLNRQLFSTDLVLQGVIADLPELKTTLGRKGVVRRLKALADAMTGVRFIGILDAAGTMVAANMTQFIGSNFAYREYFRNVKQHPDANKLYVTPPFLNASGYYSINLIRMIPGRHGEFAGIISASLDPDYFRTLMSSVLYAPDMWSSISHGSGKLYLLVPEWEGNQNTDLTSPQTMFSRHMKSGQVASVLTGMVLVTNDFRMMALHTVQPETLRMDVPLVAGTSRNYDQIFEEWRRDVLIEGGLFALDSLVSIIGLYVYQRYRQAFDQQIAEVAEALRQNEERLQLATEASRIGVWDYDLATGKLVWDDAMYALHGLLRTTTPTYDNWRDSLLPEDISATEAALKATLETGAPYELNFRIRRGDGAVRVIHVRAKVYFDELGKPVRMVGTNEDITERTELQGKLEQQARQDFLTGLFNRRYFMDQGQTELARVQRYGNTLALLMLDIDHFKIINDTHGHKVGDVVLQRLSDVLRDALRTVDIIGRIGGEEFAILLPETDLQQATEVAERLREKIAAADVVLEAGLPLHFTVSIGVTALNNKDTNLDILLNQADKALYQAKADGRNRVCVEA